MAELGFSYRTIPSLLALPPAIFATAATALGIVGIRQRDRARVPAIIGTTLGAADLIFNLSGLLVATVVFRVITSERASRAHAGPGRGTHPSRRAACCSTARHRKQARRHRAATR